MKIIAKKPKNKFKGLSTIAEYDRKTGVMKARPDIARQMQRNLLAGACYVYWDNKVK